MSIKEWLEGIVKEHEQDGCSSKQYLQDIVQHGCQSGIVSELIYYSDTIAFHDKHEEEIWDDLYEQANIYNNGNILEFLASFRMSKDVGDMGQLKNLLAWNAVEQTANDLLNELEEN